MLNWPKHAPRDPATSTMKFLGRDVSRISLNAFYLLIATGVTALFGFLFWIEIARTHAPGTVGVATLLLSVSTLLSLIGLLGLESSAVRFLSQSKDASNYVSSALFVVGAATAILSIGFCLLIPEISPKLIFLERNPLDILYFTVITVFTTWNTLTSIIFIAYRRTSFIFWVNLIVGILKLSLAIVIRFGGAITIFNIAGIAQIANVILSLSILTWSLRYKPSLRFKLRSLLPSWRFSSSAYVGNILALLPGAVLPIIVVNQLGTTEEAFFYIAFTIATLLYTIPSAVTESLYAEASHDPQSLRDHTKKALLLSGLLLLPVVVLLVVFCPFVLQAFGQEYRHGSVSLLRTFSVSSFLVGLTLVLVIIFRITLNFRAIVVTNLAYAVALLGSVYFCISWFGLIGVGVAWAFGNMIEIIVGGIFLVKHGLSPYERRS
jgi:O-antigen/teichoic acid export membrane protein